jgi:hypothetical protein
MTIQENMHLRYPLVSDSMLLQLANEVMVAEDISGLQGTLIGRLVDGITGQGQRANGVVLGNLAAAERTLMAWVIDVCENGRVTNLTLARVTRHVTDTRRALAALEAEQRGTTSRVSQLTKDFEGALGKFEDRFAHFDTRLNSLEQGLTRVQLRLLADRGFNESVEAWDSRQTYEDLPWACQVVLLAREVANGPVGLLEHVEGERDHRERLVRKILRHDGISAVRRPFVITTLFGDAAAELHASQQSQLVAELLESGLTTDLMMPVGPLTALLRTTLELGGDHDEQPERSARRAMTVTRERYGRVDATADVEGFVRRVVTEQADAALEVRRALSGAGDE